MKNAIRQRIKSLIKAEGFSSETKFALKIGCAQKMVNQQLKGETDITLNLILGIINNLPNISADWLLKGQGEIHLTKQKEYNLDFHQDYSVSGTNNVGGKNNKVTKEDNDLTSVIKTQAEQITKLTDQVTTLLQLLSQK